MREHHLADDAKPDKSKPLTIADLVLAYLDHCETHYLSRSEYNGRNKELAGATKALSLLARFSSLPAKDFGPLKLIEVRQSLVDGGISRKYCNKQTSRIRRMFKWATSQELLPPSVFQSLDTVEDLQKGHTPAPDYPDVLPVDWSHVEPVLAELPETIVTMLSVQRLTGVRSDSLCRAHVSQFDRSQSPWVWKPKHKMEQKDIDLTVYVGPKCQALLSPLMKDGYLFQPRAHAKNKRYRQHYSAGSYRQAIDRAIDRVNAKRAKVREKMATDAERKQLPDIPHWTPHQVRHARATEIRAAYGVEASQASLGHETLDMAQLYAEKNLALARKIAVDMG